jgi:hypothetical protein
LDLPSSQFATAKQVEDYRTLVSNPGTRRATLSGTTDCGATIFANLKISYADTCTWLASDREPPSKTQPQFAQKTAHAATTIPRLTKLAVIGYPCGRSISLSPLR